MAKKKKAVVKKTQHHVPYHHRHMTGWPAVLGIIAVFLILTIVFFQLATVLKAQKIVNEEIANMPNPASQFCEDKGGTSKDGVCVFEDGKQCEEWAMMRGTCPVGGK